MHNLTERIAELSGGFNPRHVEAVIRSQHERPHLLTRAKLHDAVANACWILKGMSENDAEELRIKQGC